MILMLPCRNWRLCSTMRRLPARLHPDARRRRKRNELLARHWRLALECWGACEDVVVCERDFCRSYRRAIPVRRYLVGSCDQSGKWKTTTSRTAGDLRSKSHHDAGTATAAHLSYARLGGAWTSAAPSRSVRPVAHRTSDRREYDASDGGSRI